MVKRKVKKFSFFLEHNPEECIFSVIPQTGLGFHWSELGFHWSGLLVSLAVPLYSTVQVSCSAGVSGLLKGQVCWCLLSVGVYCLLVSMVCWYFLSFGVSALRSAGVSCGAVVVPGPGFLLEGLGLAGHRSSSGRPGWSRMPPHTVERGGPVLE